MMDRLASEAHTLAVLLVCRSRLEVEIHDLLPQRYSVRLKIIRMLGTYFNYKNATRQYHTTLDSVRFLAITLQQAEEHMKHAYILSVAFGVFQRTQLEDAMNKIQITLGELNRLLDRYSDIC